jgi:hypothetical protein
VGDAGRGGTQRRHGARTSARRDWFIPDLENALGPLWWLLLPAGLGSAVYTAARSRDPILRVLAGAALLTAVLYLFTPIAASGPEGEPRGFFTNTRYVMAALVIGLMLVPLAEPLRRSERRRARVLAGLALTFAVTVVATPALQTQHLDGALVLTALVVWLPVTLAWVRAERRLGHAAVVGLALAAAALAVTLGRGQQVQYAQNRYTDAEPFFKEVGPVEAFHWAREVRDRRIGVVGAAQVLFTQYGWYGTDLSNHVQYVGVDGPNGAYTLPRTCRELRHSVNAGDYDYLVSTEYGTNDEDREDFPVHAWLTGGGALTKVLSEPARPQRNWVYRVEGRLSPAGCGAGTSLVSTGRPRPR